jgi:hypothetical protein
MFNRKRVQLLRQFLSLSEERAKVDHHRTPECICEKEADKITEV